MITILEIVARRIKPSSDSLFVLDSRTSSGDFLSSLSGLYERPYDFMLKAALQRDFGWELTAERVTEYDDKGRELVITATFKRPVTDAEKRLEENLKKG